MKQSFMIPDSEYIAKVQSDGSNSYCRFYRKKKSFISEDGYGNPLDIIPPDDSIRAYMPLHPGKCIDKRNLSPNQQFAKDLFKDIYNKYPYSIFKTFTRKQKKESCVLSKTNVVLCDQNFLHATGLDARSKDKKVNSSFDFYKTLFIDKLNELGLSYSDYCSDSELATYISNEYTNALQRIHRFEMKAYNNKFNYWITITKDPSKFSSDEDFENQLKVLFDHLSTRNKIHVMGVFERGTTLTEALHFHGFIMICDVRLLPPGFTFTESNAFNFKHKNIHRYLSCDYFSERFGINEFCDISTLNQNDSDYKAAVDYCLKYMEKDRERFYLGRHLPCYWVMSVPSLDDFCLLLFLESLFYEGRFYFQDGVIEDSMLYYLKQ